MHYLPKKYHLFLFSAWRYSTEHCKETENRAENRIALEEVLLVSSLILDYWEYITNFKKLFSKPTRDIRTFKMTRVVSKRFICCWWSHPHFLMQSSLQFWTRFVPTILQSNHVFSGEQKLVLWRKKYIYNFMIRSVYIRRMTNKSEQKSSTTKIKLSQYQENQAELYRTVWNDLLRMFVPNTLIKPYHSKILSKFI